MGAKLTKSILIGDYFSNFVKRKTEDCLFWLVHMEKKKSNMSKKEKGFFEQDQEGDNHHHHIMHSQVKKIKEEESQRNVIDWPVLAREVIMTRQQSRSRLGLISGQPISVGDS